MRIVLGQKNKRRCKSMNGNQVRPEKWTNVIDLYDNGWYSYIWGNYDGGSDKSLGVRWNGGKNVGYPNQGA